MHTLTNSPSTAVRTVFSKETERTSKRDPQTTKPKTNDQGHFDVEHLVDSIVSQLTDGRESRRLEIDASIAKIDQLVSAQLNEILHAPALQALEASWRALHLLIERTDFEENTKVAILNASKEELAEDFEECHDITFSTLYARVYTDEYGTHGGQPYSLVCANYYIDLHQEDIQLLRECAAVSAMAHTPFVSNASAHLFGESSFPAVAGIPELDTLFASPQYAAWNQFRKSPDARNVGLCMPRFLLRLPYGEHGVPVRSFDFRENYEADHEHYLWGPSSILFAVNVASSFAKYRWCPHIVGARSGGAVENLPVHNYEVMGGLVSRIPVEFQITDNREFALSACGFIGLNFRQQDNIAVFLSAPSLQAPLDRDQVNPSKSDSLNHQMGSQLPYLFIVTRLAHYIKVLQRETLGAWMDRSLVERELNTWIRQYVADMDSASPAVRARRPLRQARIEVFEVEGETGWYRCNLWLRPHFKHVGAEFSLSLVSKLDRSKPGE